ncbi:hypothetical protein [Pedobacter agri]|uniref:hypothetical protein n=1 Tax=Pedobacter agri TaxID=454586 RepID=UPI00292EE3F6|nr:hypothetical protein [Pedobacter agri]
MPENQDHPIFKKYQKRRNNNKLSSNLHNPTPASLRDECQIVYQEKGKPKDDVMLRTFFGAINPNEDYTNKIAGFDVDKFKPLVNFLKGTSKSTNSINVDLLKWLMGEENEEFLPPPDPQVTSSSWYKRIFQSLRANVAITVVLLALLLLARLGLYIWEENVLSVKLPSDNEKCMYWTGYHYQPIMCNEAKPGFIVIPLNENKLKRMQKIPYWVKVTKRDVGKLWRAKTVDGVEHFTDSGMHPVDTSKRLLPLSSYMVAKYQTEKNLITDMLYWTYYIAIFSLTLILVFQLKKGKLKIAK